MPKAAYRSDFREKKLLLAEGSDPGTSRAELPLDHRGLCVCVCVCVCVFSIELFQKMCDELKDWIGEKINGINLDDVGKDLASVKLLQRKQQNLEQELKPIEEKRNKMSMMANAYVCIS